MDPDEFVSKMLLAVAVLCMATGVVLLGFMVYMMIVSPW